MFWFYFLSSALIDCVTNLNKKITFCSFTCVKGAIYKNLATWWTQPAHSKPLGGSVSPYRWSVHHYRKKKGNAQSLLPLTPNAQLPLREFSLTEDKDMFELIRDSVQNIGLYTHTRSSCTQSTEQAGDQGLTKVQHWEETPQKHSITSQCCVAKITSHIHHYCRKQINTMTLTLQNTNK